MESAASSTGNAEGGEAPASPAMVPAAELFVADISENVNPAFDPARVLLRRIFFLNPEKSKYVSVGYYPSRNYEVCMEFGGCRQRTPSTVILNQQYVSALAERLPRVSDALKDDEPYTSRDGLFRLQTTGTHKLARMTVDRSYVNLTYGEVRNLMNMFHVLQNQMTYYSSAIDDVITYVINAFPATIYVEPPASASKLVLYYQLFDELKTPL